MHLDLELKNIRVLVFQYFISIYYCINLSFNNCIEKYLVYTYYMNTFIILILEGVFYKNILNMIFLNKDFISL